jgi:hypothetical protein
MGQLLQVQRPWEDGVTVAHFDAAMTVPFQWMPCLGLPLSMHKSQKSTSLHELSLVSVIPCNWLKFSDPVTFAAPPADVTGYLFPWVEAELEALNQHVAHSHLNQDIALRQFLKLLQWLRVVLVQDCALLYAQYPHCPIFKFVPFTFPSFTAFSANAVALVTAAEEKARLAFHNLPDHIAQSMRGYATDLQMRQELHLGKLSAEIQELKEQTAHLQLLLSASSKGSKRRTPGKSLSLIQDPNHS